MSDTVDNLQEVPSATVADDAVGVFDDERNTPSEPVRKWFVAFVGTRAEKAVRDRLTDMGIEAYAATQTVLRVRPSGRRVKVECPVITQYVFVHVTEAERKEIVEYPFIHFFLTDKASLTNAYGRHQLAVIPDGQMMTLQNMLSQEDAEVVFATTGFTVGDEVRVLGWGDNIIGHVVRIRGEKGSYIGLRIDQLGCAYMEISPNRIVKNTRKS